MVRQALFLANSMILCYSKTNIYFLVISMKYILSFIAILIAFHGQAHAALGRTIQQNPNSNQVAETAAES